MKKFKFRKLGILLVLMLVAGFSLVGPVSADGITAISDNGYFKLGTGGAQLSSTHVYYWGFAEKYDPPVAGMMELTVGLYNQGHYWVTGRSIEESDCDRVEGDGIYTGAIPLVLPYVQMDFVSYDPEDSKYGLRWYL